MVWKKVVNADSGTADLVGGNDWDKVADAFSGVDVDDFDINCDFTVRNNKLKLRNPANNASYIVSTGAIGTDKVVNEPVLIADDTRVYQAHAQTLTNKTINQISNPIIQQNEWKYVVFIDAADSNRIKCIDQDTGTIVSNNTSALTTLQFAVDNASGKPILVKRGTYVLTAQLNCVDKYVWLVGESNGENSTTKFEKAGTGNIINCANTSTALANSIHLENIEINGVDKLGTGLRTNGIRHCFHLAKNVIIKNCSIGFHFTEGWYDNFWGLWIENCGTGLWIVNDGTPATQQGGGNTLYFFGGKIQNCDTHCLDLDTCHDAAWYATIFESDESHNASPVIQIDAESETNSFYNCSLENFNDAVVIFHDEGKNTRIENCRFQNNESGENYTAYEGVAAKNSQLVGNIFGASTTGTVNITLDSNCERIGLYWNQRRRWIVPLTISLTDSGQSTTRIGNSFCDDRIANTISTAGTLTVGGLFQSQGAIRFENDIAPTQLTADQNDYNPTGLSTASRIRQDADSSFRTITGLQGGGDGRRITLSNISANTFLLANQNTGSSAGNRFDFGGYDLPIFPSQEVELEYDNTATKWRVVNGVNLIIPPTGFGNFIYNDCFGSGGDVGPWATTAASGGSITAVSAVAGHQGIINFTSGTSTTGSAGIRSTNNTATILLGNSWYFRFDCIIRLSVLSDATNTYILRSGYQDQITAEPVDGVYFRYNKDVNSGKWVLVARQNNTETPVNATNTAVAAATWYHLTIIVNPAATVAEFFENGVSLGTVTSNIPSAGGRQTSIATSFLKSAGTADIALLDIDSVSGLNYANVTR